MTKMQVDNAYVWYSRHQDHVVEIVKDTLHSYEPSGTDINHPELWKPAHWRWFLRNHCGAKL